MIKEEKNEDLVYVDQSGMDNRDIYEGHLYLFKT
jgi:hypothetical protein